jgi:transcription elongation factor Elf1
MDEKQKADYLKSPNDCPWCNSENIMAGTFDPEKPGQLVECQSCGREWHDIHALTDIEPLEPIEPKSL